MEVERDEIAVESRPSLITTQCETLNKNDVVRNDTESRTEGDNELQSEILETKDSCNLMNSQTCLQSSEQTNPTVISDEICSDSSQVSLIHKY